MTTAESFSLDDKYLVEEGTVFLSGTQALVRLPMDQHRADRRAGLNTATLITGYRGSPLGGFDMLLERNRPLLGRHQIVFMPGVNEDLAATAIFGSQMAHLFPKAKYDGVLGMWYGKGPGVDRSGDAFKHANYAGVGRYGGVLALGGDDPFSKSSTLPTHTEVSFYDAFFPVLFPGTVQEVLDLGRLGFELSRYAGLWVGFKVVTNVADAVGSAEVSPRRVIPVDPHFVYEGRPWEHRANPTLLPPFSLEMERDIHYGRLEAARAFAAANRLNRVTVPTHEAWLGIVAPGKTYYDLREALGEMGLDDAALGRLGIRLMRVGMLFPMEASTVREFARGLEEIVVVEEKRAFVELFIRAILYNQAERPRIVGKTDEQERPLVPANAELDADQIARLLAPRLLRRIRFDGIAARLSLLEAQERRQPAVMAAARQPYFCSGCPHNRSTVVPEGSMAGAGIGCHAMALGLRPNTVGITQMGGEGAQWIGMAPFTETPHMFQNIGDGTFFHSGSMAVRQAVAAGTNITFKLLYNRAVAMTGGQPADGALAVPELTRWLQSEGVKRTLVLAEEPKGYPRGAHWASNAEVWERDRLEEAQLALRRLPGVTVLIFDQRCAAEKRRLRKRGQLPEPAQRVYINEAVCEGCGDCGAKSNCLSVFPVDTEFGRKTQIHQSSCNRDYSCLLGDCPSFVTVTPALAPAARTPKELTPLPQREPPQPSVKVPQNARIFMMGIGGTGVVTINQILGTACLLEGRKVEGLDQTGLSQKGGPVASHLKLLSPGEEVSNKISAGSADTYLAFDILTAASAQSLAQARPDRTIAVVSTSRVPTGAMVRSTSVEFPALPTLAGAIDSFTRRQDNVYLDAIAMAEALFDDHMAANMILLGAAYQAGTLPLDHQSIERAITLNGVAVKMNLQAFRAGRLAVADPAWAATVRKPRLGADLTIPALTDQARALVDLTGAEGELSRLLELRMPELIAYQSAGYARQYADFVRRVREAEQAALPGRSELAENVARYLFKLMAYKDEYEVARLHLKNDLEEHLAERYPGGVRVEYHLHPPLLRALGFEKKVCFGPWFKLVFRLLAAVRRVRGTPLDIFAYSRIRRLERNLVQEYRSLIEQELATLTPASHERAVKLAALPDIIRGYEAVKLANVERFREEVRALKSKKPLPKAA